MQNKRWVSVRANWQEHKVSACEKLSITQSMIHIYTSHITDVLRITWLTCPISQHTSVLAVTLVDVDDDTLVICPIRSWTGRGRTTRTWSQPHTLDFVKLSRWTKWLTPLCSLEHSRTKPSMCIESRRNARKAARARRLCSNMSRTPSEAWGGGRYISDESLSSVPKFDHARCFWTHGSLGQVKLQAALFSSVQFGSTYRSLRPTSLSAFSSQSLLCRNR